PRARVGPARRGRRRVPRRSRRLSGRAGAPYGAILPHEDDPARLDAGQVGPVRSDNRVEWAAWWRGERLTGTLPRLFAMPGVRLDHDDLEAGETERHGMDPGEADLEHPCGRVAEQGEDLGRRAGRECRREPHVSRRTAIAQAPRAAAPRVKAAVTASGPPSPAAACQMPTRPREARSRTPVNDGLLA